MKATTKAIPPAATRRVQMVAAGMLVAVVAALSTTAWAQPTASDGGRFGGGMHSMRHDGHHGMHGGGHAMFGSPERMGRMIDRMLDGLNATDAQRAQIKQIAAAAAGDLRGQMAEGRALRERAMGAFTAPNVDAQAAEQVRQQMLQQHDRTSRRMTQAMLDVARVLTPEQRAKVAERMRDRRARMEDRMRRFERERPMQPAPGAPAQPRS